ncbi:MAG: polysaccharide deacetylase family protein, partial [candidate division Zixibacteria bacterium]
METTRNIFTVDLEEWYVVEALAQRYQRDDWSSLPSLVVKNSLKLLDMLNSHNVRATWFILGWVADRHPDL